MVRLCIQHLLDDFLKKKKKQIQEVLMAFLQRRKYLYMIQKACGIGAQMIWFMCIGMDGWCLERV